MADWRNRISRDIEYLGFRVSATGNGRRITCARVLESSKAAPIFGATLRALEELRRAEDSPSSMIPFSQLRVPPHNRFRSSSSSSSSLLPCCYDCENCPHPVAVDLFTFEARLTAIFSWTTLLLPCFSSSSLPREGRIGRGALKPKTQVLSENAKPYFYRPHRELSP